VDASASEAKSIKLEFRQMKTKVLDHIKRNQTSVNHENSFNSELSQHPPDITLKQDFCQTYNTKQPETFSFELNVVAEVPSQRQSEVSATIANVECQPKILDCGAI
jgi:hypothetical protein